jgi:hypothetical protein
MSEVSCVVTPKVITFTSTNVLNTFTVFNPHLYPVKFTVLSNQPDFYQIKGSKGELTTQQSQSITVRVKKEKQNELFSSDVSGGTEGVLAHTFLVRAFSLEPIEEAEKAENPKRKAASVRSVIKLGNANMSTSLPPPRTQPMPISPVQSTTAMSPPKSILKTRDEQIEKNTIEDIDDERPTTWNGILHYAPVIFGGVIIFLLTKSQKIDYETAKLLWASFMVGLGAMFVQLKLVAHR